MGFLRARFFLSYLLTMVKPLYIRTVENRGERIVSACCFSEQGSHLRKPLLEKNTKCVLPVSLRALRRHCSTFSSQYVFVWAVEGGSGNPSLEEQHRRLIYLDSDNSLSARWTKRGGSRRSLACRQLACTYPLNSSNKIGLLVTLAVTHVLPNLHENSGHKQIGHPPQKQGSWDLRSSFVCIQRPDRDTNMNVVATCG